MPPRSMKKRWTSWTPFRVAIPHMVLMSLFLWSVFRPDCSWREGNEQCWPATHHPVSAVVTERMLQRATMTLTDYWEEGIDAVKWAGDVKLRYLAEGGQNRSCTMTIMETVKPNTVVQEALRHYNISDRVNATMFDGYTKCYLLTSVQRPSSEFGALLWPLFIFILMAQIALMQALYWEWPPAIQCDRHCDAAVKKHCLWPRFRLPPGIQKPLFRLMFIVGLTIGVGIFFGPLWYACKETGVCMLRPIPTPTRTLQQMRKQQWDGIKVFGFGGFLDICLVSILYKKLFREEKTPAELEQRSIDEIEGRGWIIWERCWDFDGVGTGGRGRSFDV